MNLYVVFQPLNMSNYLNVTKVIKRNLSHHNNKQPKALSPNLIQAPLATMEPIEIGDYAQVKVRAPPLIIMIKIIIVIKKIK